jgi:hypothetical protein
MSNLKCRRGYLYLLSAVLLTAFTLSLFVDVIPPHALTATQIEVMARRIEAVFENNGALPESIESLPKLPGYNNETTDAWGRQISYQNISDPSGTTFLLTSFGRDGKPGGRGKNSDITCSFSYDGKWMCVRMKPLAHKKPPP